MIASNSNRKFVFKFNYDFSTGVHVILSCLRRKDLISTVAVGRSKVLGGHFVFVQGNLKAF